MDRQTQDCLDGDRSKLLLISDLEDSAIYRCACCESYIFNDKKQGEWDIFSIKSDSNHDDHMQRLCERNHSNAA